LASLVLLALICRVWIPVGFMPAAIGEGGPVAVCHSGTAGEFFRSLQEARLESASHEGHATHGAHDGSAVHEAVAPATSATADHAAWEHCPFGAAFGAALVSADVDAGLLTLGHALEPVESARLVSVGIVSSYRARAPPFPAIHV
jgi:hypothetical protein